MNRLLALRNVVRWRNQIVSKPREVLTRLTAHLGVVRVLWRFERADEAVERA